MGEEQGFTFFGFTPPPKPVGYWVIYSGASPKSEWSTSTRFAMYRKPRWLTRFLMKYLVEIHWVEEKEIR